MMMYLSRLTMKIRWAVIKQRVVAEAIEIAEVAAVVEIIEVALGNCGDA